MGITINDLRESNQFLNILIENITAGIFIVDREMRLHTFNDGLRQLFFRPGHELMNQHCGNALGCRFAVTEQAQCGTTSHCERCNLRSSVFSAMTEEVPVDRRMLIREFEIDGVLVEKYLRYSTRHIVYQSEDMVLVVVDDVTELEMQRRKLDELNQLKNRFLGIAAHDLRNPIGVIKSASYLLDQPFIGELSEKQSDILNRIKNSAEFMLNLVNDLLDISHLESGKLELEISSADYIAFLKQNVEYNQALAEAKQIKIVLDDSSIRSLSDPALILKFDNSKLQQVLNNLISNAIKYSAADTTITVQLKVKDQQIYTAVVDQGQGIPDSELPAVYEEFKKTSVKSTAGEKSTGLGLAIVKKVIESHGGSVGVESEVGQGSTFWFVLPRVD